jgi:glucoamylase
MSSNANIAPGAPGMPATWTSSAKSGIGKSIDSNSYLAFTIGHGILNEVFYPREDIACIRDMELLVTDGNRFFSEEKRDTNHEINWMKEGVPAFHILNTCKQERYSIEKEIISDPLRDTILQQIIFKPSEKYNWHECNLYALLSPHINNNGTGNNGWKGYYQGIPMLFAQRDHTTLAFACSSSFLKSSAGYVGVSDGYTDLKQHFKMEWEYEKAPGGNIALTAQIDFSENNKILLAVGFGSTAEDAANQALSSMLDGFDLAKEKYIYEWQKWQRLLKNIKSDRNTVGRNFRTSAAVLRVHDSKKFPGGIIASLSIPWGQSKSDGNLGGYHLVWPRDLALSSGGFLELETKDNLLRVLNYLMSTQKQDGSWSQNMWLEGVSYWNGVQMDQVALAILLVGSSSHQNFLDKERMLRYWPVVRKAIIYLIKNGPATEQDRWEEESGLTPFTLAAEIAALLAGAALAEANHENEIARYCRETADYWNSNIERWLYVTETDISKETGVEGYYFRINPTGLPANEIKEETINLKNHQGDDGKIILTHLISVDALALVRFGLRSANDPRILNTIKVIDAKLKVDTPSGPCWHRYTKDGYGEDVNGDFSPTNGIGRAWPLLTGERGHYEIAAGNITGAKKLLKAMELFSNNSLLPEQIWDTTDIPEKGLFFGKHSGSAMPLTWAHAEYIKLCSSIKKKRICDLPMFTEERYIKQKTKSLFLVWRFNFQEKIISFKQVLRIEVLEEAIVRWTDNNWETWNDVNTKNTELGVYVADIDSYNSKAGSMRFTFFWKKANHWENKDFEIKVENEYSFVAKD